jgi:predicted transcriptional regulator
MPDPQPIRTEEADDWDLLLILLSHNEQRPWSIDELARELGDQTAAIDSINRLQRAGLIHRTNDGFIFATRPAVRFAQIVG